MLATSYIVGAIPFAQIVARLTSATDLREQGSGTVSASSLNDVAGVGPVVVAGLLDVAKGTVGPLLAGTEQRPTLAAIARCPHCHRSQLVTVPARGGRPWDITRDGCAACGGAGGRRRTAL